MRVVMRHCAPLLLLLAAIALPQPAAKDLRNRTGTAPAPATNIPSTDPSHAAVAGNPPRPPIKGFKEEQFVIKVTMRDGVRLNTRVVRPAGSGRLPVLLIRTPY